MNVRKLWSFNGRTGRKHYIAVYFAALALIGIIDLLQQTTGTSLSLLTFLVVVAIIPASVRRLHDLGYSARLATEVILIPFISPLLLLGPGEPVSNASQMSTDSQRSSRLKRFFPWYIRAVYIVIILAFCDCVGESSLRRDTFFSRQTLALADGGTRGYIGFGYSLTYYRRLGSPLLGPVVWFWFAPFKVSLALRRPELIWFWHKS